MIDHVAIPVQDFAASAAFYTAVLAPLGGKQLMSFDDGAGYGADQPQFWLEPLGDRIAGQERHVAFAAGSRDAVVAFHRAAVTAGAEVLHEPRLWPEYHPHYFAAFFRDPDGNNVEAVCHIPE